MRERGIGATEVMANRMSPPRKAIPIHLRRRKDAHSRSYNTIRLTLRLGDAGMRCRQTKLTCPNHRLPSMTYRSCGPRPLQPIVRCQFRTHYDDATSDSS